MDFKYYSLEEVTKLTGYSESRLLYLATQETIGMGIIVGNGITLMQVINSNGVCINEGIGPFPGKTVKLTPHCLNDYEAGCENTEVLLANYFRTPPSGNSELIKLINKSTGQPLLVKDSNLIIYAADLKILQELSNNKKNDNNPVKPYLIDAVNSVQKKTPLVQGLANSYSTNNEVADDRDKEINRITYDISQHLKNKYTSRSVTDIKSHMLNNGELDSIEQELKSYLNNSKRKSGCWVTNALIKGGFAVGKQGIKANPLIPNRQ